MTIHLRYMGFLPLTEVENDSDLSLDEPMRVVDLLNEWDIPSHQQQFFTPYVNEEKKSRDYELQDGDSLFLYLPVGGG